MPSSFLFLVFVFFPSFSFGDLNRAALPPFAFVATTSRPDLGVTPVHGLGLCLGPASPPAPALIFWSFASPRPGVLCAADWGGVECSMLLLVPGELLLIDVESGK